MLSKILVRHDADAVDLDDEIIPHSANLLRLHKLNHSLPQLWIYLQTDAEALLHLSLTRDVADVEGHALNSTSVLATRGIIPASRNPRARIAPLELLGHVPDLIPAHCRFLCRHSRFFFLQTKLALSFSKMGHTKKRAAELHSPAARIKNNLIHKIYILVACGGIAPRAIL